MHNVKKERSIPHRQFWSSEGLAFLISSSTSYRWDAARCRFRGAVLRRDWQVKHGVFAGSAIAEFPFEFCWTGELYGFSWYSGDNSDQHSIRNSLTASASSFFLFSENASVALTLRVGPTNSSEY